ncbi:FAD-binding oxidoreductase [Microbacterium sp. NPDC058345]|uniref:FAD-binding oxidoreductase n=1 Tax=Microbacterium sp. NPDC058345 TaxID=3346455 RepID=UPI003663383D
MAGGTLLVSGADFGWRRGRLALARSLTASARSLTFTVPGWPGNDAGQHVDIRLTAPDGYQAVRSYSLAASGQDDRIEIAVERLPDGEVSPFLVDELDLGDVAELRGPLGRWFVWRPDQDRPVQLIAGGSGVVPLVAMIRAHADARSTAPMQLLYSLRSLDDALYRDELISETAPTVTTWHYTRTAPSGWPNRPGRLTVDDLRVKAMPPERKPLTYICGPTGFVEAAARMLTSLGHAPDDIRTERFGGS